MLCLGSSLIGGCVQDIKSRDLGDERECEDDDEGLRKYATQTSVRVVRAGSHLVMPFSAELLISVSYGSDAG